MPVYRLRQSSATAVADSTCPQPPSRQSRGNVAGCRHLKNLRSGQPSCSRRTRRGGSQRISPSCRGYCAINARGGGGLGALKQKGRTERPLSFEEIGGAALAPPLNTK